MVFSLVDQFDAERLPIMGLPLWYLVLSVGAPANNCLDAVLTLQAAYRTFGIEAVPAPAELLVDDGRGGLTGYGDPRPRFEDGYLVGHAGLWLPESRRFIDPTVQQFPEIRGTNPIPVFVPFPEEWHHFVGQPIHAVCAETMLTYRPLALDLLAGPTAEVAAMVPGQHHRAGNNLATNFLDLIRQFDNLRSKVEPGPYPRLKALLAAVDGAEIVIDDDNFRIRRPGDLGPGVYLDELDP